jgi:hypothetical protein
MNLQAGRLRYTMQAGTPAVLSAAGVSGYTDSHQYWGEGNSLPPFCFNAKID